MSSNLKLVAVASTTLTAVLAFTDLTTEESLKQIRKKAFINQIITTSGSILGLFFNRLIVSGLRVGSKESTFQAELLKNSDRTKKAFVFYGALAGLIIYYIHQVRKERRKIESPET